MVLQEDGIPEAVGAAGRGCPRGSVDGASCSVRAFWWLPRSPH